MYSSEVVLKNETGLHARPASLFVSNAAKFSSEIKIIKDEKQYNAKSIFSILGMGAITGDRIKIVAEGNDEKEAVEYLAGLVESNFGEM